VTAEDPPRRQVADVVVQVPHVSPAVPKTAEQYEAELLTLKAEIAEMKAAMKEKVVHNGWLVALVDKVIGEAVERRMSNN
ncbi:hypothetical protein A2U01_0064767, partial [Trifolium medium]|nr:hypothetical protein [Trifolium medium]